MILVLKEKILSSLNKKKYNRTKIKLDTFFSVFSKRIILIFIIQNIRDRNIKIFGIKLFSP